MHYLKRLKLALLFLLTLSAIFPAESRDPRVEPRQGKNCRVYATVWYRLRDELKNDTQLASKFIRASFHDCITATKSKTGSGCNGSLRLEQELQHQSNKGLEDVFTVLDRVLSDNCVTYADGIQVGLWVAMEALTGEMPRGNFRWGREDATEPDLVDGELPDREASLEQLAAFYARKGFSVRELVVSLVGGHAVGSFFKGAAGPFPFTNATAVFTNWYALNLVQRMESGANIPGFNTLQSDEQLISCSSCGKGLHEEVLIWLKFYAGKARGADRFSATMVGLTRLKKDFNRYLLKQGMLSSSTVEA